MGLAAAATAFVAGVLPESLAFAAPLIVGGVAGAGLGAIEAGITGGDVGEAALFGGIGGAVTGGAGELFGGAGAGAASSGGSAASAAAPIGSVASSAPVDLATAADAAAPTSAFATDVGTSTVSGLGGVAAGTGDLGSVVGAAGAAGGGGGDAGAALSSLSQGAGGGVAAPAGNLPSAQALLAQQPTFGGVAGQGGSGLTASPSFTQGGGSILDKLATGAENSLTKNPIGTAISGAGLLANTLLKPKQPDLTALQNEASAFNAQQAALTSPLTTGQLPAGAQAAVNQGVASAKAAMRAKYASLGLSGSTMEAQDLANIDMQAQSQVFSIANQLFQSGMSEAQISTQIYNDLLQTNTQQNAQTGQAIANLAGALNGGGGGSGNQVTLKVA
jgi:hypothetical protein